MNIVINHALVHRILLIFLFSGMSLNCSENSAKANQDNYNFELPSIQVDKCMVCGGGKSKTQSDTTTAQLADRPVQEKCGCGRPRTTRDTTTDSLSSSKNERCNTCGKPRTIRDTTVESISQSDLQKCSCGKPRTFRDSMVDLINSEEGKCSLCSQSKNVRSERSDVLDMVDACCEYCEQPDSLGCQGENSIRCRVCLQGRIKKAIREIAACVEVMATNIQEQLKNNERNRFPRETFEDPSALIDPCIPLSVLCCPSGIIGEDGSCYEGQE